MNCKPNDLAVVVRTLTKFPATAQFLGRIVRLTKSHGADAWHFENEPLRGKWHGKEVHWYSLPDEFLRPLRDPGDDAVDETLREREVTE